MRTSGPSDPAYFEENNCNHSVYMTNFWNSKLFASSLCISIFLFICFLGEGQAGSHCSLGRSGTHYVAQAGFHFSILSQYPPVLRLQVWAASPNYFHKNWSFITKACFSTTIVFGRGDYGIWDWKCFVVFDWDKVFLCGLGWFWTCDFPG